MMSAWVMIVFAGFLHCKICFPLFFFFFLTLSAVPLFEGCPRVQFTFQAWIWRCESAWIIQSSSPRKMCLVSPIYFFHHYFYQFGLMGMYLTGLQFISVLSGLFTLLHVWPWGIALRPAPGSDIPPFIYLFWAFPYLLSLQDAPDSSCTFPASALESATSLKAQVLSLESGA